MPKTNVDYSKTVIYKIICNDENVDYIYVGSTTDFTKRKYAHKCSCNNINDKNYNQKKYVEMRQNDGWDNFKMLEVEKYNCNDKQEAEAREEEIRVNLKANMNSNRCFLTEEQKNEYYKEHNKEYYIHNKDKFKEHNKEYYIHNKEKINEKHKEYRNINKEKIKEQHREYYNENKQKRKEYYNDNKDKIKEQHSEKFDCPCGCISNYGNKSRHFKSAKHLNYLESQNK